MKKQTHKDRMDEKLAMMHGKEAKFKQSMASRRHESAGMHHKGKKKHHSMKHSKEDLEYAYSHMKKHGG